MREIVTLHVRERVEAYRPGGLEAIIGVAGNGEATDVSRKQPDYLHEALEARIEKKLGRGAPESEAPRRSKAVRPRSRA